MAAAAVDTEVCLRCGVTLAADRNKAYCGPCFDDALEDEPLTSASDSNTDSTQQSAQVRNFQSSFVHVDANVFSPNLIKKKTNGKK